MHMHASILWQKQLQCINDYLKKKIFQSKQKEWNNLADSKNQDALLRAQLPEVEDYDNCMKNT